MNINAINFKYRLADVLYVIGIAEYVCIDLEMTGIRVADSYDLRNITHEQVYERIRAAASKFQAVQLGVTVIANERMFSEKAKDTYKLYTFVIPISPMFVEDSRESWELAQMLDRSITLSYNSFLFLRRHNFRMEQAFGNGVTYLSREEQKLAEVWCYRETRGDIEDEPDNQLDLEEYDWVRQELDACFNAEDAQDTETLFSKSVKLWEPEGNPLKRSTIRAIRFILKTEYPGLRCWLDSGAWAMNVVADREGPATRKKKRDHAVAAQIRLSIVVEALFGGSRLHAMASLADLPPDFAVSPSLITEANQNDAFEPDEMEEDDWWDALVARIRGQRRTVVGHNLVYDLAFLHAMFIGPLPDSLQNFQCQMHGLVPQVVDTKLLWHMSGGRDIIDRSLEETYDELALQMYPRIETSIEWSCPLSGPIPHDAGFDSYMTAVVFLKLACRKMRLEHLGQFSNPPRATPSQSNDVFMLPSDAQMLDEALSPADRFLPGRMFRLPFFRRRFWNTVRNRLRMSAAGTICLDECVEDNGDSPVAGKRTTYEPL